MSEAKEGDAVLDGLLDDEDDEVGRWKPKTRTLAKIRYCKTTAHEKEET